MSLVSNILLQICEKFIGEVLGFLGEGQVRTIDEMEVSLKDKTDKFVLEMMNKYLEVLDQAIVNDKVNRKKKGIVVERRSEKREIYTQFGQLEFQRSYFFDKKHQEYSYLLDKAVGLEGYERITGTVTKELVEHAGEASYGESSRHVSGGEISRQSVMKKVHSVKGLKIAAPAEKRQVRVLHVDADEDHVALQDGSNTMVPLISIHEGVEKSGRRGRCKNIHHISSYSKSTDELWLETAKWIDEAYEIDDVERIYLHGDGASWIKQGLSWLPNSKPVLDKYHLNRAIITATGRQKEQRKEIYTALREGNKVLFKEIVGQLLVNAVTENELKRIKEFRQYIQNNWDSIVIYSQEACGGSCAEGHVSHVLSSRLSSRPMGWSKAGLAAMSEIRAFCSNGGRIEVKHIKANKSLSYRLNKTLLAKVAKTFQRTATEKLANLPALSFGKVKPLYKSLRGLQNGQLAF